MNERSPTPLTEAKSVRTGATRPTPADMREFPDDTTSPAFPDKKRLVCAASRASSKRLALTLIDEIAGLLGVNADAASARRMLDVDRGAYPGDQELKSRMRTLVEERAARG